MPAFDSTSLFSHVFVELFGRRPPPLSPRPPNTPPGLTLCGPCAGWLAGQVVPYSLFSFKSFILLIFLVLPGCQPSPPYGSRSRLRPLRFALFRTATGATGSRSRAPQGGFNFCWGIRWGSFRRPSTAAFQFRACVYSVPVEFPLARPARFRGLPVRPPRGTPLFGRAKRSPVYRASFVPWSHFSPPLPVRVAAP